MSSLFQAFKTKRKSEREKDGRMERGGGQGDNNERSAKLRLLRHIIPPSRTPLSLQKGKTVRSL